MNTDTNHKELRAHFARMGELEALSRSVSPLEPEWDAIAREKVGLEKKIRILRKRIWAQERKGK